MVNSMKKRFEVRMDTYSVSYIDNSRNRFTIEVEIPSYTRPKDIQQAIKCEVEVSDKTVNSIISYTKV